jgi:hypothetical protein
VPSFLPIGLHLRRAQCFIQILDLGNLESIFHARRQWYFGIKYGRRWHYYWLYSSMLIFAFEALNAISHRASRLLAHSHIEYRLAGFHSRRYSCRAHQNY